VSIKQHLIALGEPFRPRTAASRPRHGAGNPVRTVKLTAACGLDARPGARCATRCTTPRQPRP